MKIDRDKKGLSNYTSLKKAEVSEVRRGTSSSFGQELNQKQGINRQYKMQEILAEIDKVNERLGRSLNINDLMTYKMLVKNFLKEASLEAFELDKQRGRSRRGRSMLLTIKTIDKEIEEVINDFIKNKTAPTEVLEQLDKIKGMLLDLMA